MVAGVAMFTPSSRLLRMALTMAIASVVWEWESIVTRAFHSARECDGIWYLNVGIRGVITDMVGTGAGGMRSGIEAIPRTPLWSRDDIMIVCVGPVWVVRP